MSEREKYKEFLEILKQREESDALLLLKEDLQMTETNKTDEFGKWNFVWKVLTPDEMNKLKEKKEVLAHRLEGLIYANSITIYGKCTEGGYYYPVDTKERLIRGAYIYSYEMSNNHTSIILRYDHLIKKYLELDKDLCLAFLICFYSSKNFSMSPEEEIKMNRSTLPQDCERIFI